MYSCRYYCAGDTNPEPTGKCEAGYYCTGSSSTPHQFPAKEGHYAVEGSANMTKCPVGTYQPVCSFYFIYYRPRRVNGSAPKKVCIFIKAIFMKSIDLMHKS